MTERETAAKSFDDCVDVDPFGAAADSVSNGLCGPVMAALVVLLVAGAGCWEWGVLVAERLFANEAIKICIIPMP